MSKKKKPKGFTPKPSKEVPRYLGRSGGYTTDIRFALGKEGKYAGDPQTGGREGELEPPSNEEMDEMAKANRARFEAVRAEEVVRAQIRSYTQILRQIGLDAYRAGAKPLPIMRAAAGTLMLEDEEQRAA